MKGFIERLQEVLVRKIHTLIQKYDALAKQLITRQSPYAHLGLLFQAYIEILQVSANVRNVFQEIGCWHERFETAYNEMNSELDSLLVFFEDTWVFEELIKLPQFVEAIDRVHEAQLQFIGKLREEDEDIALLMMQFSFHAFACLTRLFPERYFFDNNDDVFKT